MTAEQEPPPARHGAPSQPTAGQSRITIRIDNDILAWFHREAATHGATGYLALMNEALREHVQRPPERLDSRVRRVIRDELSARSGGQGPAV